MINEGISSILILLFSPVMSRWAWEDPASLLCHAGRGGWLWLRLSEAWSRLIPSHGTLRPWYYSLETVQACKYHEEEGWELFHGDKQAEQWEKHWLWKGKTDKRAGSVVEHGWCSWQSGWLIAQGRDGLLLLHVQGRRVTTGRLFLPAFLPMVP